MIERDTLLSHLHQTLEADRFKDYGPNGLQVEGKSQIRKVVTGVTASLALIEAAVAEGADALLVHHRRPVGDVRVRLDDRLLTRLRLVGLARDGGMLAGPAGAAVAAARSDLGGPGSDFGRGLATAGSDHGGPGLSRSEFGEGMGNPEQNTRTKDGAPGQVEKKQPTRKIDISALDQSFEFLEASILESQQAESRLSVVEEGGLGFSDEPEIKAGWREAWNNKFIQEKALRAAIKQLEFSLAAAMVDLCRVCYEETLPLQRRCLLKQSLIAWLCTRVARLNVLIIDLEEGSNGDWKPRP